MKRALTLEQMDTLVRMGVPTENANRGYERNLVPKSEQAEYPLNINPGLPGYVWSGWKPTKFYRKWENNPRVQSRPAFNIENMIGFLPKAVDHNYTLQMGTNRDGSWFAKYHSGLVAEGAELLDVLYELYLKCHEQKKL